MGERRPPSWALAAKITLHWAIALGPAYPIRDGQCSTVPSGWSLAVTTSPAAGLSATGWWTMPHITACLLDIVSWCRGDKGEGLICFSKSYHCLPATAGRIWFFLQANFLLLYPHSGASTHWPATADDMHSDRASSGNRWVRLCDAASLADCIDPNDYRPPVARLSLQALAISSPVKA